jgi:hypothetical protein
MFLRKKVNHRRIRWWPVAELALGPCLWLTIRYRGKHWLLLPTENSEASNLCSHLWVTVKIYRVHWKLLNWCLQFATGKGYSSKSDGGRRYRQSIEESQLQIFSCPLITVRMHYTPSVYVLQYTGNVAKQMLIWGSVLRHLIGALLCMHEQLIKWS